MLKKIEIGLTIVSILLGTYEILGRTDVVKGPTPIEAVQDAVGGGSSVESTPRPAESLEDLTLSVQGCQVVVDAVVVNVAGSSATPISTFEGVSVSATSGALTDSVSLLFDNSTTSTSRSVSLVPGAGTHTITLVIDPDDRYPEADESNNVAVVTADVPVDTLAETGTCSAV